MKLTHDQIAAHEQAVEEANAPEVVRQWLLVQNMFDWYVGVAEQEEPDPKGFWLVQVYRPIASLRYEPAQYCRKLPHKMTVMEAIYYLMYGKRV